MADNITIRFYEELNDFLPAERRKKAFDINVKQLGSVKDLIESLAVPHTEIDLILVNGESVDFNYTVKSGDRISVYPKFESLDISSIIKLRPAPLRDTRFVLDTHLGRLAAYLRLLGFDTLYRNDYDDPTLAEISAKEKRILLTRDIKLLMRKKITHGTFVRATQPQQQLLEIISRLDLRNSLKPFSRCLHCNGKIQPVDKSAIMDRLMPRTIKYYNDFWQCKRCRKVYWKGSHYLRMQQLVENLSLDNSDG